LSLYLANIGIYMYRTVVTICTDISTILRSAHRVYLCVLCGSENKQQLFPYTALTGRIF
jgi:anaerobic ribonucleoside-triphosphate reductase